MQNKITIGLACALIVVLGWAVVLQIKLSTETENQYEAGFRDGKRVTKQEVYELAKTGYLIISGSPDGELILKLVDEKQTEK